VQASERDVVIEIVYWRGVTTTASRCRVVLLILSLLRLIGGLLLLPWRLLALLLTVRLAVQHLHLAIYIQNNLSRINVMAFFVRPLPSLQFSLDVDFRAFFKVLAADLGQLSENYNLVPFSFIDKLAAFVLVTLIGGNAHVHHGSAGRGVANIWILAKVAY
jgi:hypothetical protein